jgi:hypothetical protein
VVSGWVVEATSGIDKSWTASIARGEQDRACPAPAVGRNTLLMRADSIRPRD